MSKIKNSLKGFTIIELLVVVAIIGLLSTMTVAAVKIARKKAKIAKAQHDIDTLYTAISTLANDTNQWPGHQVANVINLVEGNTEICGPDINSNNCATSLSDLSSGIIGDDTVTPYIGWHGVYIKKIPIDSWNHEYFFDTHYMVDIDNNPCNGAGICSSAVVVGSYGPDGKGKPDGISAGSYGEDDIIKIIMRN